MTFDGTWLKMSLLTLFLVPWYAPPHFQLAVVALALVGPALRTSHVVGALPLPPVRQVPEADGIAVLT